ncbi:MAG: PilZ domain-containing protein [Magnetococcales bacterium]|nr:PilZ domain-containing protein [Magnetococcales bacterium]
MYALGSVGGDSGRQVYRVQDTPLAGVVLNLAREGGHAFDVTLVDLSPGGCAFHYPEEEEPFPSGTPLQLTFHWCVDQRIALSGTLLRIQYRDGAATGHVGFGLPLREESREVGALVRQMERIHLRVRKELSPRETEQWRSGAGRSLRHGHPCSSC